MGHSPGLADRNGHDRAACNHFARDLFQDPKQRSPPHAQFKVGVRFGGARFAWIILFDGHGERTDPNRVGFNARAACARVYGVDSLDADETRARFVVMKPKHVALLLAGLAIAGTAAYFWPSAEPLYDGRPLSYWFHELPITMVRVPPGGVRGTISAESVVIRGRRYGALKEKSHLTITAIQKMGTNAIPFLFGKLEHRQSPMTKPIEWCASKCRIKKSVFANVEIERAQSITALLALEPLPGNVIDRLQELRIGTNTISYSAAYIFDAATNETMRATTVGQSVNERGPLITIKVHIPLAPPPSPASNAQPSTSALPIQPTIPRSPWR